MRRVLIVFLGLQMVAATACGDPNALSAQHRELAAYLAAMYRIQGDQLTALAGAMPSSEILDATTQEELLDQQQQTIDEIDAIFTQYVADLKAIEPPESAAGFHTEVTANTERYATESKRILEDLTSDDVDVVLRAQQDQANLLQDISEDNQGLADELAGMVNEVLADRTDAESVYVLELLDLQTTSAVDEVQDLLGELETAQPDSPEEVTALIDQAIGVFETIRAGYAAITPPPRWEDLHARQIAFLDEGIALYTRFGAVLVQLFDDPESVDLDELQQLFRDLLDWAGRAPALNAAFTHELADYFEDLAA